MFDWLFSGIGTEIFKKLINEKEEVSKNQDNQKIIIEIKNDAETLKDTDNLRKYTKELINRFLQIFKLHGIEYSEIPLFVDKKFNIRYSDICDAIFGTEYEIIGKDSQSWSRKDDGLFGNPDFSKKVAGVIAMKRKPEKWKLSPEEERFVEGFAKECTMTPERYKEQIERKSPVTDYRLILYMNNSFKQFLEDIKKLLSFDTVVYYNMRPPMGNGNFGLSR